MEQSFMQTAHTRSMQELGYLEKQKSILKIPIKHSKEPRKHEEIQNGDKRTYLQHSIITMGSAATKAVS